MSLLKRLTASLRGQGIADTLVKFQIWLADHWFDIRYGLDTCSWSELKDLTIESGSKNSGYRYQPARILPLRKFFKTVQAQFANQSTLVDFGSGKGRVLLVASEFGFRELRGIEFARELCEVSRMNSGRYKSVTGVDAVFKTIEADAAHYAINADECVFVMYNPFDDSIMKSVLANINLSIQMHPRRVFIVYYNPRWGHLIEQQAGFSLVSTFDWCGYEFSLYSNQKPALN